MTTRPLIDSGVRCGWGRSWTEGAIASRPLDDQGYELEELKEFEPMFELEHRQAAPQLTRVSVVIWSLISLLGAAAFGVLALVRGETINAAWLLIAAVCTYVVAYRFYSKFLADKVFGLDPQRATPAERFNNGHDFVPTNRWVLFGHHFAAIAGAGPLVWPVLAAQFGFLPGTLWLVIGVVLGGAGQDFRVPLCSVRPGCQSPGPTAHGGI